MMHLRKQVVLTTMLFTTTFNVLALGKDVPTSKDLAKMNSVTFEQMNAAEQVSLINALKSDEKEEFLKNVLPGSTLNVQPNGQALFLDNGEFIFDPNTTEYFVGRWKVSGQNLVFNRDKNMEEINFIRAHDEWVLQGAHVTNDALYFDFQHFGDTSEYANFSILYLDRDDIQWRMAMEFYEKYKKGQKTK
jgi:hypothetical protein